MNRRRRMERWEGKETNKEKNKRNKHSNVGDQEVETL
jgi:hypothetical protein